MSDGLESQWFQTLDFINRLLKEHENGTDDSHHERTWNKLKQSTTNCSNVKCLKAFGFFVSSQLCKRCGKAFCKQCLSCERRLNGHGELDLSGILQKVCLNCFNDEEQTIGHQRSHFETFLQFRKTSGRHCFNGSFSNQKAAIKISNFRENVDLEKECRRIRQGFKESLKGSFFGIVLPDLQVPAWKKSTFWVYGNMASKCNDCGQEFSLMKGRSNCVVCGCVVCAGCSTKDLLVYIPDGDDPQSNVVEAQLAIIRIIGCPDKEPQVCSYLHVCQMCNTKIQDRQVAAVEKERMSLEENKDEDVLLQMSKICERLTALKMNIESSLAKYNELVQFLDAGPKGSSKTPGHKSNMQVLAKTQGDLSDHITTIVTIAFGMKRLKPSTQRQLKVLRNILMSSYNSYHDYRDRFHELQKLLENVASKEILTEIQTVVNRNAINSFYLSVKQLALEVLYLSDKHNLAVDLLPKLIAAEEIAQEELKCVLSENWSDQEKLVNQFLDLQLKQHRFIRPSRRLLAQYGGAHVQAVIGERTEMLLQQMYMQFHAKSSDSMFPRTKEMLKQLRLGLSGPHD